MVSHSVNRRAMCAVGLLLATIALACPLSASAAGLVPAQENVKVTSFDGTNIDVNFFPAAGLQEGQTAPTVMVGSFWGLPAYPSTIGLLPSIGIEGISIDAELVGPAALINDGYNVVTWDARGWYESGGQVNLDNPNIEGRDVTSIINWLATQPGVKLKEPNYPVVGMTGFSYGGGIQLSAAAVDHRLAVIEPNMSWYSLIESLYPNEVVKQGWGRILCATGDVVGARYAPQLSQTCNEALNTGSVTAEEVAYANAASPGPLMKQITTPTLLLAGTVDTLFPLNGNVRTYEALKAAGTPVKMMWYCGGHGICNESSGPEGHVIEMEFAFLNKYLKGQEVSTGPGFEYLDQTGTWHSASSYPVASTGQVSASGGGLLGISPLDTSGLLGVEATPALNALNISVSAPSSSVETLSDPQLSLTYSGLATKVNTPIFAQLVETSTGKVLDNQATPVPLVLNGFAHTVSVPLNLVAWNLTPSSHVTLQLTDASDLFFEQLATGFVSVSAKLKIPTSP
jgi:ABC-2 type transport system ATP-binding protein